MSGPEPQPSPSTSKARLKTTIFWKAMGCSHHEAMVDTPPSAGLKPQKNAQPATYTSTFSAYATYTATGAP